MKGKKRFLLFLLLIAPSIHASQEFNWEFGIGVDYGGLGSQLHIPIGVDSTSLYLASGLFYASTNSDKQIGFGTGINYFPTTRGAFTLYVGTLNVERALDDDLQIETKPDYGVSIGYKYYFNKPSNSGLSLGVNYNIYEGDSYPFFSVGYRF